MTTYKLTPPPDPESVVHPFIREVPVPIHADDCKSHSSSQFRLLYLAAAIIALIQVISLVFIVKPKPADPPIAPTPENHEKQGSTRLPRLYCSNGTVEMPVPLTSSPTDASRFLVLCGEDDAVVFCSEPDDIPHRGILAFVCGSRIGGPVLSIRQFLALMERITQCIDQCKSTSRTPNTSSVDMLGYVMGHGIVLTIDRHTGRPRMLTINRGYTLTERDIGKLQSLAVGIKRNTIQIT